MFLLPRCSVYLKCSNIPTHPDATLSLAFWMSFEKVPPVWSLFCTTLTSRGLTVIFRMWHAKSNLQLCVKWWRYDVGEKNLAQSKIGLKALMEVRWIYSMHWNSAMASPVSVIAVQKLRLCICYIGCKIFAWVDPKGVINIAFSSLQYRT